MYKILILIFIIFANSFAEEWQVDKKADNSVVFNSSTTLLDFKGTTDKIDGFIYWEGDSLFAEKSEVYFEVTPATFNTGLGKRDSDMREDVLETDKYPLSSFSGEVIKIKRIKGEIQIVAKGKLLLHGKEKPLTINAVLHKTKDKISVKSNFSIFLKDFDIDAPSLMAFVKVAQEIKLEVMFDMFKAK